VHFLYDRWLYKFSGPQVRATIGADMFTRGFYAWVVRLDLGGDALRRTRLD
jgi:hypothetical protein